MGRRQSPATGQFRLTTCPRNVTDLKGGVIISEFLRCTARLRGGLDVHEHVCDAGVALLDCRLHPMRDLVALVHGNLSVNPDV
jgi:hypothetical protein